MSYVGVQDRFQIQMLSMEEFIEKENAVRFVDAFVGQLELDKLGFDIATLLKSFVKHKIANNKSHEDL